MGRRRADSPTHGEAQGRRPSGYSEPPAARRPKERLIEGEDGLCIDFHLLNGEVRRVSFGAHTGSVGNALDRLEEWIETDGGTWIQKRFIVEAAVIQAHHDTVE